MRTAAALLLLLAVAGAFSTAAGLAGCEPAPRPSNLIVISIDTLRADHLGLYGYSRNTSPKLDSFASDGVAFEYTSSTSPWTLPSHGSMLTGLYPAHHGLRGLGRSLSQDVRTLAEVLRDHGYATVAFANSTYFSERYGLQRGFDEFTNIPEDPAQIRPSLVLPHAARWVTHTSKAPVLKRPFFLFVHLYDVHSDYRALPRFARKFRRPYQGKFDGGTRDLIAVQDEGRPITRKDANHLVDLYDGGILQTDFVIGEFLRILEDDGLMKNTVIVVTSDHGEEFLEHGSVLHGSSMHDEILRVPLIIRGPGVAQGMRVDQPASLVDIAPTALSLLGLTPPDGVDGIDLSDAWRGKELPSRLLFAEADHRIEHPDHLLAVRDSRYKLHRDRRTNTMALFDLEDDPGENHDISAAHPEVVERLNAGLARLAMTQSRPTKSEGELTEEQIERLRSLGYVIP